ncbi:MAG: class I SAM-dependent methyltransferase [Actinomycetota bacterium]|nr:class I SAM-dependent methyltransferase [Actinomycetota bacterium]
MGAEIDLMRLYPKPKNRMTERPEITDEDREISRRFDFDYFDGDRRHGYGGFGYHPRFWTDTVDLFTTHYGLTNDSSILDVGCGKGFMLKDFSLRLPGATLAGVDISRYAIDHADPDVADLVQVADASDLPFPADSFDLVISINTVHNLDRAGCVRAFAEIQRVSRGSAFVMVDGWKNTEEQELLQRWVLTARTMLSSDDWLVLMAEAGYEGDYAFWNPLS